MQPTDTPTHASVHAAVRSIAEAQGVPPDPFADERQQIARLSERLPKVESAEEATEIAVQLIGLAAYLLGALESASAHQVQLGRDRERADAQARALLGRVGQVQDALAEAVHQVPAAALSLPGVGGFHRAVSEALDLLRKPLDNGRPAAQVADVARPQEVAP